MADQFAALTFLSLALYRLDNNILGDKLSNMANAIAVPCEAAKSAHELVSDLYKIWVLQDYSIDMLGEVLTKLNY